MGAALKVLIGLILLAIGLGLFADSVVRFLPGVLHQVPWLDNFVILLTGVIPIFLILLGLLIVWLEVDEIKMEKGLKQEGRKEPAKTEKKSRK